MRFIAVFIVTLLFSQLAVAEPEVQITGKIERTLKVKPRAHQGKAALFVQPTPDKTIALMQLKLSSHAWKTLSSNAEAVLSAPPPIPLPKPRPSVQLGMNGVPVFDQGDYGTCATFANTAAIDAAIGKGDYISQVCLLQLGQRIERLGYIPSGWDGAPLSAGLKQMELFGVVNKNTQLVSGCGGLKEYPAFGEEIPEEGMSFEDYGQLSESLLDKHIVWTPLLDAFQGMYDRIDFNEKLEKVKRALTLKERLTLGVMLIGTNDGHIGATGTHAVENDTWVLTHHQVESLFTYQDFGGHAMIITGFDDNATAVDSEGRVHKGLLTLRNSWGETSGHKGDFYMSYDYFKLLALEIQRIRVLKLFGF